MACIEVLTRCYKRPNLLTNNIGSLEAQTCGDWIQTLLVDNEGLGIGWSHENMADYAPNLTGDYIWILDDDDMCIRSTLVAELKEIIAAHNPDVIMLRMDHGARGVLPDTANWHRPPKLAHIGVSAYVVRREVWQANAGAWYPGVYHSDFNFIKAIFDTGATIYWHDVIASRVQQIGLGHPERGQKCR